MTTHPELSHFGGNTAPGYPMIGAAMFRDLMSEYGLFVKAREALALAPNLQPGDQR